MHLKALTIKGQTQALSHYVSKCPAELQQGWCSGWCEGICQWQIFDFMSRLIQQAVDLRRRLAGSFRSTFCPIFPWPKFAPALFLWTFLQSQRDPLQSLLQWLVARTIKLLYRSILGQFHEDLHWTVWFTEYVHHLRLETKHFSWYSWPHLNFTLQTYAWWFNMNLSCECFPSYCEQSNSYKPRPLAQGLSKVSHIYI